MADLMTRLADAALAWDRARRHARSIKDERDPIDCEREERPLTLQSYIDGKTPQEVSCWRLWKHMRGGEGFDRDDIPNWCASCQRRQALTDALRKANQARGARLREMRRLAGLVEVAHAALKEQLNHVLEATT